MNESMKINIGRMDATYARWIKKAGILHRAKCRIIEQGL